MTIAVGLWTDLVLLWACGADGLFDARDARPMDGFTTPRLVAERLRERHLDDLVALHLDPEVSRYLGGIRSAEATKTYLATNLAHWDRHGFGLWAWRTFDGGFVGRAGIRPLAVEGVSEIEVAYALTRDAWGRGYAGEMTQALVEHGLEHLKLPSLVGVVMVEHVASRRVLEKAGFTLERNVVHTGEPCVLYRRTLAG
jgi:RimJ/RimL family protein N-acetyltransferase